MSATVIRNIIIGGFFLINVSGFLSPSIRQLGTTNSLLSSTSTTLFAKKVDPPPPPGETVPERRERIRKKIMKKFYNENGVAFAPWAVRQINEEALVDAYIAEEDGVELPKKSSAVKKSILDRGEIDSSDGMKWRMSGNQVELAWRTGGEDDNLGFSVEKRPSYGGDFTEIASFKEVSSIATKGVAGGRYTYLDPSTARGSWIYRVKSCDTKGKSNVLCQCFVEVQTESDNKSQLVAVVAILGVLGAAVAAGVTLDPKF